MFSNYYYQNDSNYLFKSFPANQHSMDLQADVAGDEDDPEQLGRLVVRRDQRSGRHGRPLLDS